MGHRTPITRPPSLRGNVRNFALRPGLHNENLSSADRRIHHQRAVAAISQPIIHEADIHRPQTPSHPKPSLWHEAVIDVIRLMPALLPL